MKDNLSIPEYLMLEYAPKFHTEFNEFQQFWEYQYNIDPEELLEEMFIDDLICEDSIAATLNHSNVATLKSILKKFELKCTGKKSELVSRLLEETDYDTLDEFFPQRYYTLTELGASYKNTIEFENVLLAHRHPNYNIKAEEIPPGMKFNDYAWMQFNKRSMIYSAKRQWGLYRNTRLNMADLLYSENKLKDAFVYYIEICACDISNLDTPDFLTPGILERLNKLQKKIGYSDSDLLENVKISLKCLTIPIKFDNIDDVVSIITQKIIDYTYEPSDKTFKQVSSTNSHANHSIVSADYTACNKALMNENELGSYCNKKGEIKNAHRTAPLYVLPIFLSGLFFYFIGWEELAVLNFIIYLTIYILIKLKKS